jgi:hypothetical protein
MAGEWRILVAFPSHAQASLTAAPGPVRQFGATLKEQFFGFTVQDATPAFVIEPGIYIREAALDNLPKTAENAAFIEKVRPAVQKYRNSGVRIEDSFLLTGTGLDRLSSGVPRTIAEIERFMAGKK